MSGAGGGRHPRSLVGVVLLPRPAGCSGGHSSIFPVTGSPRCAVSGHLGQKTGTFFGMVAKKQNRLETLYYIPFSGMVAKKLSFWKPEHFPGWLQKNYWKPDHFLGWLDYGKISVAKATPKNKTVGCNIQKPMGQFYGNSKEITGEVMDRVVGWGSAPGFDIAPCPAFARRGKWGECREGVLGGAVFDQLENLQFARIVVTFRGFQTGEALLGPPARCPFFHPFFGWEGSPTKIDRKKLVPLFLPFYWRTWHPGRLLFKPTTVQHTYTNPGPLF